MAPPPLSIEDMKSRYPLGHCIGQAYRLTLTNLGAFLRLSWKWLLLLLIPIHVVHAWYVYPLFKSMHQEMLDRPLVVPIGTTNDIGIAAALLSLVTLLPLASIAVGWHRLILRGEPPSHDSQLRFDGVVLRYAGLILLFCAAALVPSLLQLFLTRGQESLPVMALAAPVWAPFLLFVVIAIVIARLSVTLPGVALGNPEATLAQTVRRTRGYTPHLFVGCAATFAPLVLAAGILNPLISMSSSDWVWFAGHLAISLSQIAAAIVLITFLSLSYRHFYERDRARLPGGAQPLEQPR
jgi:hypothetical protein